MGVTVRVVPRVTQNDGGRSIEVSFMPYRPGLTGEPSGLKRVTAIVSVVISRSGNAQAAGVAVVGVSQRQAGIIVPVESWQSVAYCPGGHFGKPVGFRREVCLRVKFEHNRHLIGPSSGGDVDGAGPLKVVPTSCKKHGRQHKCCPPCRLI